MVGRAFSVNLNKPLVFQVGHLGEAYDEWVHQPIVTKGSPRFFANDFLEFCTRTPWWVVPLVWLPVVWWFVSSPTKKDVPHNDYFAATMTMVAGVGLFSFIEYCLHRFLLHMRTTTYWGNTFHYVIHGCHHKHPMDSLRLVMPPLAATVFISIFWNITKLIIPAPYTSVLFGGELLGYIIYDCTHYYLHHTKPSTPGLILKLKVIDHVLEMAPLKRCHMDHHFKAHFKGFGVTTAFWDWMFGTLPSKSQARNRVSALI